MYTPLTLPLSGRGDVNGKRMQTLLPCNTPLTGVSPRDCGQIDRYDSVAPTSLRKLGRLSPCIYGEF